MLDANKLAHELHRRRTLTNPNAPRHQAAGEAKFCARYDFMPTLEDFDSYMALKTKLEDDRFLTVVTGARSSYEVTVNPMSPIDIYVFTVGEKLSDCRILGWLPLSRVRQSPTVDIKNSIYLVNSQCLYPMPDDLNFEEPVLDSLGVWDYELQALWTPAGNHVYSDRHKALVNEAESIK